jgi:hypothetical protein
MLENLNRLPLLIVCDGSLAVVLWLKTEANITQFVKSAKEDPQFKHYIADDGKVVGVHYTRRMP